MTHHEMIFILRHNGLLSNAMSEVIAMSSVHFTDKQRAQSAKRLKQINRQLDKLNKEITRYYTVQTTKPIEKEINNDKQNETS